MEFWTEVRRRVLTGQVSRAGYCAWKQGCRSSRAEENRRLMPRTTDNRHCLGYSPTLLLDSSPPHGMNRVWVGDISYVPLSENGFLYLAMLMDLYSRRLVGWELQANLKGPLVLAALRSAITETNHLSGMLNDGLSLSRASHAHTSVIFYYCSCPRPRTL